MNTLKNEELKNFLLEAEQNFNADGDYFGAEDDFGAEGDYYGAEDDFGAEASEDYAADYLQAISSPTQYLTRRQPIALGLSPRDQTPFVIRIENTNATTTLVNLFRSYAQFAPPAGVNIELLNSIEGITAATARYIFLINSLATNPLTTLLWRLESQNTSNLSGTIVYVKSDFTGANTRAEIPLLRSPNQFDNTILELPWSVVLDGYSGVQVNVAPTSTLLINIFVASRVNLTNLNFGQSPVTAPVRVPSVNAPARVMRPVKRF
ncbi:MAG: hypothetical protein NC918_06130 [Candidatus Omnitrophica bacterium]|nr:hypothetical protein [Candidatus Omnitrophota bacterium]